MSKKIKWFCVIFLFLSGAFVVLEIFFRCFYTKLNSFQDVISVGRATPYTMFSKFDYGKKESPKTGGELRIFVIGGSAVAYGKPPLPVYVEQEIKKRGFKGVHVFNYGVIAQNSSQEVAHLVFHVLDSEPDIIVIYNGGNDIMSPLLYDPRPGYPFNFLAYENNVLFTDIREYPLPLLIAYGSEMMRHLFRSYFLEKFGNFSLLRLNADYGTNLWAEKIAKIYASNLAKAGQICKAYNVEYVAFFQPLIFYKRITVSNTEKNILKGWPKVEADLVRPYTNDVRSRILRNIRQEQKKFPFSFHDFSGIFADSTDAVFTDYIHVNAVSNKMIAAAICDRLMETIAKRTKK
ncbi:MAG: SGNH/GDSL hydrolase family protein [Syntrophaceae bacterium]|nr:SGNH/GDSL hydrolase family protein [Syntrophaceae bacterium]